MQNAKKPADRFPPSSYKQQKKRRAVMKFLESIFIFFVAALFVAVITAVLELKEARNVVSFDEYVDTRKNRK